MARYFENPHPYSKTLDNKYWKYIFYVLFFVAGMGLAYLVSKDTNLIMALVGFAVLGISIYIFELINRNINRNWSGVDGEKEIRKILSLLPHNYAVFQNVPIKKNLDIDFVLVGPIGVYAIEVKSHKRYPMFATKFIGQTHSEAMGLKEYLKKSGINIYVEAMLVFSRAYVPYQPPSGGVKVINKKFLLSLIQRARSVNFDQNKAETAISNLYKI